MRLPISPAIRRAKTLGKRVSRIPTLEWYATCRRQPVNPNVVLYESFAGNGALDNPLAIYRSLIDNPEYAHLTHVWVLDKNSIDRIPDELRRDRVVVVRRRSPRYFFYLATAGYLFNNATFPPEFSRRELQVYVNTWHGTPIKAMGFDMPDGAHESANTLRNFLMATHLLSQNRAMTDGMYLTAYKLQGIYRGRIVETGYPRNDLIRLTDAKQADLRASLKRAGIDTGDRRVVLYAPTWRGASFQAPEDTSSELARAAKEMQDAIDEAGENAIVLVKAHQAVYQTALQNPGLSGILVPNSFPTNELLGLADTLVSDYSSTFVDYLATGRPIVFAALDADSYETSRGLSLSDGDWPGTVCRSFEALGEAVVAALAHGIPSHASEAYRTLADRFVSLDDGRATERVIDVVFHPERPLTHEHSRIVSAEPDAKPSVMLFLGALRTNGITSSALNLLRHLADDTSIDVTAFYPHSNGLNNRKNRALIDSRIRQVQRLGGMNGSKVMQALRRWMSTPERVDQQMSNAHVSTQWRNEWHRCFGDARFDYVIDFSGYGIMPALICLHSPDPAERSVWMHNDIAADAERTVDGVASLRKHLMSMAALYRFFDNGVSVSHALSQINRDKLGITDRPRMGFARNMMDAASIIERSEADLALSLERLTREPATGQEAELAATVPPPGSPQEEFDRSEWRADLAPDSGVYVFAIVGRLSPEKNHERAIRAFAEVHAQNPATRLVIIGGGPLFRALQTLRDELGLRDSVTFTGAIPNPYPLMRASDCIVVSSNYEGQPMVILEAAVLGRPIVSTDFGSVADALPTDTVHIVSSTPEALAGGMRAAIEGRVPASQLDSARYNREALDEFYRATGIAGASRRAE